MAILLMPLPARDFDPTEAAVPWKILTARGHEIVFATPDGRAATADEIMLDGVGLDPWGRIPLLRRLPLLGRVLRANADGVRAHRAMRDAPAFREPLTWGQLDAHAFDALILPGGHRARGMREYLESSTLHRLTADFFASEKPVGAICHGVLLAARSSDATGRSVLWGRRVTALTWQQEKTADRLAKFGRWWDPGYYRTYPELPGQPEGFMSVEQEVTRALGPDGVFENVPTDGPDARRKTQGLYRDSVDDTRAGWVVVDGRFVSARWPGDAHLFAYRLAELLEGPEAVADSGSTLGAAGSANGSTGR